jgi:hypothetical protein
MAWGLDEYPYRDSGTDLTEEELLGKSDCAEETSLGRGEYEPYSALLNLETAHIRHLLDGHARRNELRQEYEGLDWTLGVVDLRRLLTHPPRVADFLED